VYQVPVGLRPLEQTERFLEGKGRGFLGDIDTPTDPDVYPIGFGLIKISDRNSDYPPIRDLKAFPKEH